MANCIIGIDWGTSRTKVCYFVPGPNPQVSPVFFCHDQDWYFPSLLQLCGGQVFARTRSALGPMNQPPLEYLKSWLASEVDAQFLDVAVDDSNAKVLGNAGLPQTPRHVFCGFFLASVAQIARRHIVRQNESLATADFYHFVCFPSDPYGSGVLKDHFQKALVVAQTLLSPESRQALLTDPNSCFCNISYSDLEKIAWNQTAFSDKQLRWFLSPEAEAHLCSYTEELNAGPVALPAQGSDFLGVHSIYDIGASTTDISIIALWRSSNGTLEGFKCCSESIPCGMKSVEIKALQPLDVAKPWDRREDFIKGQLQSDNSPANVEFNLLLQKLKGSSDQLWQAAYGNLRAKKNWNLDHWAPDFIPPPRIFCLGGAGGNNTLKQRLSVPWHAQPAAKGSYSVSSLPVPPTGRWAGPESAAPFSRMAVAYGLVRRSQITPIVDPPPGKVLPQVAEPKGYPGMVKWV
ncbi:MAG: hypothetical protein SF028_03685 [Candidatus Sumerlaeia bacterium]|nr:hypothetical protein [Candidatus Sumerlaeia bacterium]